MPGLSAPGRKNAQGVDEEHRLARHIADQDAFGACKQRAGQDDCKLQSRCNGGEDEEGAETLFADQVVLGEGTDRLDEQQGDGEGRDTGG